MKFRKLRADEIDCKIKMCNQYGVLILLYKDARCDMNILDETVGVENWQRSHEVINGNLFCNLGIRVERENGYEWVWKQDVGTESFTEKEKGEASDSFKRASFNFGIGRELYSAPRMFVMKKYLETLKESNGKWTCYDYFTVIDIEYNGEKIALVKIRNEKNGEVIEFGQPAQAEKEQKQIEAETISPDKVTTIKEMCKEDGVPEERIFELYKVSSFPELTELKFANIIKFWDRIKAVE